MLMILSVGGFLYSLDQVARFRQPPVGWAISSVVFFAFFVWFLVQAI